MKLKSMFDTGRQKYGAGPGGFFMALGFGSGSPGREIFFFGGWFFDYSL